MNARLYTQWCLAVFTKAFGIQCSLHRALCGELSISFYFATAASQDWRSGPVHAMHEIPKAEILLAALAQWMMSAPPVEIVADRSFGTRISESSSMTTFTGKAHQCCITPELNDQGATIDSERATSAMTSAGFLVV
jgi:hypothetical protein